MDNKNQLKFYFIKKYKEVLITFLFIFFSFFSFGQNINIGLEYIKQKEYEKAKDVFSKLVKQKELIDQVYPYYLDVLIKTKEFKIAEKFVKKQLKNNDPKQLKRIDLALLYEMQDIKDEADVEFNNAIEAVKGDELNAQFLANYLIKKNHTNLAVKAMLGTRQTLGKPLLFAETLANVYKSEGKFAEMLDEYLTFADIENNIDYIKAIIQDEVRTDKQLEILENLLYEKVQKYSDSPFYTNVLIAFLVNQKMFYKAFLQAKALDKRLKYNGEYLFDLGVQVKQNKDYTTASKIFDYLAKEYPKELRYPVVRRYLINCREESIKTVYPINVDEIKALIADHEKLIKEIGLNQKTIESRRSQAALYSFYLDQKDSAKAILNEAIKLGRGDLNFVNKCKLDLGDIQLLDNDYWEATLTYQQVEKSEKDTPIGYEAKLKNAKLNYFKGDFELANDILDILKKATSREIANDAMLLSLLIQENTGDDSTEVAMKCFAAAERLLYQNKLPNAIDSLSFLIKKYSGNSLIDDALYLRANCYLKMNNIAKSIEDLKEILGKFPTDVLGDDALFLLAKTTEEKTENKEEAMKYYQQILEIYPGSIFGVEARTRYRMLRGDTIN